MIVYKYNEEGYYIGTHKAQKDPLDGGYAVPLNTTEIKPDKSTDGYITQWDGTAWNQVVNNIGVEIWNTETGNKEICTTVEFPEGYTLLEKPEDYYEWNGTEWEIITADYIQAQIDSLKILLTTTDRDMGRIMEDVITALGANNTLKKEDLPDDAIEKITLRETYRAQISVLEEQL